MGIGLRSDQELRIPPRLNCPSWAGEGAGKKLGAQHSRLRHSSWKESVLLSDSRRSAAPGLKNAQRMQKCNTGHKKLVDARQDGSQMNRSLSILRYSSSTLENEDYFQRAYRHRAQDRTWNCHAENRAGKELSVGYIGVLSIPVDMNLVLFSPPLLGC